MILALGPTFLVRPEAAHAATRVSGTTISSNATWTLAGSPYILDGNVTVAAGATLTIEPGVVVKFNGQLRYMWVNGALQAVGTPESRITFTSIQDDSIGGDDGADGATVGAPGQWHEINLRPGSTGSVLSHVDVRYGGYGSANWAYGAVSVSSSAYVLIDNAKITDNQRSAVKIGTSGSSARIQSSELLRNGNGVSVNAASVEIVQSVIADNSADGVWFNLPTTTPYPATPTLSASDITRNGRYGVYIGANGDYPLASMPRGSGNNVYGNLHSSGEQLTVSGYPRFKNAGVNWRANYWGDVYYHANPAECTTVAPYAAGRPAYRSSGATPPASPLSGGTYLISKPYPQPHTVCGYSVFATPECGIASRYINDGTMSVEFEQAKPVDVAMTCAGEALLEVKELETDQTTLTDEFSVGYVPSPGQTPAQVIADYEPMVESLVDELNQEGEFSYSYSGDAPVRRMTMQASPNAGLPPGPVTPPCSEPWWPSAGRIVTGPSTRPGYVGQRFIYQRFAWTAADLARFKDCRSNLTYEPSAVFDNYDGLHYHGRKLSWISNLPRRYNDTRFDDVAQERNYTVGTGDVHQLNPLPMRYFTLMRTAPGNASMDRAKVQGQHGHRVPASCYSTWCIFGRPPTVFLVEAWDVPVPGAYDWLQ